MKTLSFTFFVLLSMAMQSQQITQQFNFSQNELEITPLDSYDLIRLTNQGFLTGEENAGKPQLPVAHYNILLPQGATATNVSITVQQEQQITGGFNLYPAQLPAYPNFEDPPAFVAQDLAIYNSNTQFPQDYLLDFSTNGFRDYNYVSVSFIPFKYLPQSQQLFLLSQVSINVNYTVNGSSEAHKLRPYNNIDEAAHNNIKQSVTNSNDIEGFYPDAVSKINDYKSLSTVQGNAYDTSAMPSLEGNEVQYVIITNNTDISGTSVGDFTTKFQEYANWKTQSGTPAKIITVDDIRANYAGADIAEKIRNFIQDAHLFWGTEYVLLGGGASIVPVRWINGSYMPTDLYYSAIYHPTLGYGDNWNADGDTKFAENISNGNSPDYADYMPDIAVGRIPVDTNDEAETFLKKNFSYARCSFATNIPDGIWLDRELMGYGAAFNSDWNDYCALRIGYEIIQDHHDHTNIYGMFEYNVTTS